MEPKTLNCLLEVTAGAVRKDMWRSIGLKRVMREAERFADVSHIGAVQGLADAVDALLDRTIVVASLKNHNAADLARGLSKLSRVQRGLRALHQDLTADVHLPMVTKAEATETIGWGDWLPSNSNVPGPFFGISRHESNPPLIESTYDPDNFGDLVAEARKQSDAAIRACGVVQSKSLPNVFLPDWAKDPWCPPGFAENAERYEKAFVETAAKLTEAKTAECGATCTACKQDYPDAEPSDSFQCWSCRNS